MSDAMKLLCAQEAASALSSHDGGTEPQILWFRKWVHRDPPTTAQNALACFVADYLHKLIQ